MNTETNIDDYNPVSTGHGAGIEAGGECLEAGGLCLETAGEG